MRELTFEEMDQIDGGVLPAVGIVLGASYGAYSGYQSGGVPGAIAGIAFGSVTGFFGGVASMAGAVGVGGRIFFGAASFGTHAIGHEALDDFSEQKRRSSS